MSTKSDSRERAMLLLFEMETKGQPISEIVGSLDVSPEKYTLEILDFYEINLDKVNKLISEYSKGWKAERLPAIDRAVLRLAIVELLRDVNIPVGTIISEAVSMCEKYSTDDSPKFVNGVLGTIAHKVRGVELILGKKTNETGNSSD